LLGKSDLELDKLEEKELQPEPAFPSDEEPEEEAEPEVQGGGSDRDLILQ
jgi:hypothetical protein